MYSDHFHVRSIRGRKDELTAAIYLQVSIISQALIFVTRSVGWSFLERPGALLISAFCIAQLIATFLAVYANWGFAHIKGIGWGWAGVIWLYSIVTYFPLDIIKFFVRYVLSEKAWTLMLDRRTALTTKKDFGMDDRQAQWASQQRTLHGLPTIEVRERTGHEFKDVPELAGEAKRRAEIARLRELNTLKGHVESVVRLKGIDAEVIRQSYTL
ncbi:hypothetical protein R1sor_008700 [Riccia sorocarpa]|uniref:Uncharacterized protein n=1 Tax=Riccia sorocarpa TaxID=122646 RepID=A0ABD3HWC0_9MARC